MMATFSASKGSFTDESNFIVQEARAVCFTFGGIFIVLSFIVTSRIVADEQSRGVAALWMLVMILLMAGGSLIAKGFRNIAALTINKNGIYRCNELLTDWDHFSKARITQHHRDEDMSETGSISDDFVLIIAFEKEGQSGYFVREIKISSTWDKSEEEMIAAIRYFSKFSNKYNE